MYTRITFLSYFEHQKKSFLTKCVKQIRLQEKFRDDTLSLFHFFKNLHVTKSSNTKLSKIPLLYLRDVKEIEF